MKNNFCEECGNKISAGNLFCEQCGTPVSDSGDTPAEDHKHDLSLTFRFFQNKKIDPVKHDNNVYYGILLTNFKKLKQKFGREQTETLKDTLKDYLEQHKRLGVYYLVLDASNNMLKTVNNSNWKKHVNLLRKGIKHNKEKLNQKTYFVMLFGGTEIVPMPVLPNPNTSTTDTDVDSDLPYSTLSVKDPMDSAEARMPRIPVGRIPTGINTTVNDLITLLRNTRSAIEHFPTDNTFGLSANCWQEVSKLINDRVCKESLYISPALTIDNLHQYYRPQNSIHYFNLHGSPRDAEWYGQHESNYPEAFAPGVISESRALNIIGVEACYGARFIGLTREDSILLSALASKTVSFAGSSRIAFGPPVPPMNQADIVIHDYLAFIQKGWPAGEAFLKARVNGFRKSRSKAPATSLLTMLEFNLFGDPVFFIADQKAKSIEGKKIESKHDGIDGDDVEELPDDELEDTTVPASDDRSVYGMVTQAVDQAQRRIAELINKQVWDKYPEFKDIEPTFRKYRFDGEEYKSLMYRKELDKFDRYLVVNTDEKGNIIAEFDSK